MTLTLREPSALSVSTTMCSGQYGNKTMTHVLRQAHQGSDPSEIIYRPSHQVKNACQLKFFF